MMKGFRLKGRLALFGVVLLAGCGVQSDARGRGLVARTDFDVPSAWQPAKILGRDFWPMFHPGPWACPSKANDEMAKKYGMWPRPDWPLFKECGLHIHGLATPIGRISNDSQGSWDATTWRYVPGKRRAGKTGPIDITEFFSGDSAGVLAENPKPDVPILLKLGYTRSPIFLDAKYDLDLADYAKWKAAHPNVIGLEALSEAANDIELYTKNMPNVKDPETKARLAKDFPPPDDPRGYVDFTRRMWDRVRGCHFGETNLWVLESGSYSQLFMDGVNGAAGFVYEGSGSYGLNNWQVMGAFLRGAARQFAAPYGWYMAHFYSGPMRDGKKWTWGENKFSRYPWQGPEKAPKPDDRDAPYRGTSQSLVARQSAYGYFIGSSLLIPENAHMLFYEEGPAGSFHPNAFAKDMNDLYVFSKEHERGRSYSTTAILIPISDRYLHSRRGWDWGSKRYWFDDIFSLTAVFHTLVPYGRYDAWGDRQDWNLRKRGFQGCLVNTPYGEFWDVMVPDGGQDSAKFLSSLANYKCAFLIGEYRKDELDTHALEAYVRSGGTLIVPSDAVTDGHVSDALAGLHFTGRTADSGAEAIDACGTRFALEDTYAWETAVSDGAKPFVTDDRGNVAVWANEVGKGRLVTVACWRMLPKRYRGVRETLTDVSDRTTAKFEKDWWVPILTGKRTFGMLKYLFARVQDETLPVKVTGNVQFGLLRVADGWNVWLMNHDGVIHYSMEPEEFDASKTSEVTVDLKALAGSVVTDVKTGARIAAGSSFTVAVAPGEWRLIHIGRK